MHPRIATIALTVTPTGRLMAIIYLFHLSLPGLLTLANLVMNPLRGLGQLTWMEIKIFMREPLGAIGTIFIPVLIFVAAGRASAGVRVQPSEPFAKLLGPGGIPALVSFSIIVGAGLARANTLPIYREGGILKRLRATPLRPWTILSAHVIVKLLLTAL